MKRFLITAFVAVILAAWVVPASAVDFSGQLRIKGEWRNNTGFNDEDTDNDTSNIVQRTRLTAVGEPTDDTTVKITIQDTRAWGANNVGTTNGPNLTDNGSVNTLDLHEAYVLIDEFFNFPLDLKAGRQVLAYGDQRLIGGFGWSNNARSFDALKWIYNSDSVDVDIIQAKITDNSGGGAPTYDANDQDEDFYAVYSTIKTIPNNTLDAYILYLREGDGSNQMISTNTATLVGIDETQDLWTLGLRLKGAISALDYTIELPFQSGDIKTVGNDYDISAWALAAKVGYALPTTLKSRIGAQYLLASGDDDATDNDIETFSNIYPTNHGHMGAMDQQGWRNVEAISFDANVQATDRIKLAAAYWIFKLSEQEDGWYGAGHWNNTTGATGLRAATSTNTSKDIGSEIDLAASYKYNDAVSLKAGVSRFFTDDFIQDRLNGNDDSQDWAYLVLTANF